ncbi:hypothetical protein EDD22DRAFT_412302 [Suillus occidentalis]|nr:hypothetical protein EDD22DRAFT_412302 [Suillus occidentalis]
MLDPLENTLQALEERANHLDQAQDPSEIRIIGVQQFAITAIHASDLTLGLQRVPAGFYVTIKADSAEFQTSNTPAYVDQTIVQWNERILLPCEPSSKVRVRVYASFELGPMICHGELLRTFEISVRELLDRSENSRPIIFQPEQGEVVSPCTSLLMTLEQQLSDEKDVAALCSLTTVSDKCSLAF